MNSNPRYVARRSRRCGIYGPMANQLESGNYGPVAHQLESGNYGPVAHQLESGNYGPVAHQLCGIYGPVAHQPAFVRSYARAPLVRSHARTQRGCAPRSLLPPRGRVADIHQ